MVKNEKQHIEKTRAKQGFPADSPEPYKIAASTPFDFGAKNLTPYGGLFPVSTMLEKLGFKKLIEETLTCRSPKLRKALNLGRDNVTEHSACYSFQTRFEFWRTTGLCDRRAPESKRCFLSVHALVRNRFMAHDSQTA